MKKLTHTSIFISISATLVFLVCVKSANTTDTEKVNRHVRPSVSPTQKSSDSLVKAARIGREKKVIKLLAKGDEEPGQFTSFERSKRQIDEATVVIGLRIRRGTTAQKYMQVKTLARRVERSVRRITRSINNTGNMEPERSVGQEGVATLLEQLYSHPILKSFVKVPSHNDNNNTERSRLLSGLLRIEDFAVSHSLHKYHGHEEHQVLLPVYVPVRLKYRVEPMHSTTTPAPPTLPPTTTTQAPRTFVTITQRAFYTINYNYSLASTFRDEYLIQTLQELYASGSSVDNSQILADQRFLVVNPAGVICPDVCDTSEKEGVGYGTIGICTPSFCQCDYSLWRFTQYKCPSGTVFDPILTACSDPRTVILCNDDLDNDEPAGYGYGGSSSGGYSNSGNTNANFNRNTHNGNASIATPVSLGTLAPASSQTVRSAAKNAFSSPQTATTGNNNNYVQQGLLNNLSPEQTTTSLQYSTNFGPTVNQMTTQQIATAAQFRAGSRTFNGAQLDTLPTNAYRDQLGTLPANTNGAQLDARSRTTANQNGPPPGERAVNQLNVPSSVQDSNQFGVVASQEVVSFSQVEPSSRFVVPSDQNFVTPLASTALESPVRPPSPGTESIFPQGVFGQGANDFQGQIRNLRPEQIQQLQDMARQFVAQNRLTAFGNSFAGR